MPVKDYSLDWFDSLTGYTGEMRLIGWTSQMSVISWGSDRPNGSDRMVKEQQTTSFQAHLNNKIFPCSGLLTGTLQLFLLDTEMTGWAFGYFSPHL